MRTLRELLALLRAAGLDPLAWYGGLAGEPLHLDSRRLVLVSRRSWPSSRPPERHADPAS